MHGTPASNVSATTGAPDFVLTPFGLPEPRAGSPLHDSGLGFVPGGAGVRGAAGQPRVAGQRIDRGALELPELFRNGFE